MGEIQDAQEALLRAREHLAAAVRAARAQGRTWADIGEELGMSRQAAFKRFGEPMDPTNSTPISTRSVAGLQKLTEDVFTHISAGDYETLATLMHPQTVVELPADVIADAWRRVLGEVGALERFSATRVELAGGAEVLGEHDTVIGTVVGATVIQCEAGEVQGRVAFDENNLVVGLLVLPMEHGPLPF